MNSYARFFNPDPEEIKRRQEVRRTMEEKLARERAAAEAQRRRMAREMERRRKRQIVRMQGEAMARQFWSDVYQLEQRAQYEERMRQERMRRSLNGMTRNPHLNW